ncbi:MAG: glycine zipper domain-containing protein [Woeseia sp.]
MQTTNHTAGFYCLVAIFVLLSQAARSQDIYVYPANEQTDAQLAEDRYRCHRWAVDESGFDPSQFDEVVAPRMVKVPVPRNEAKGAANKGAVSGAVVGAVIGSHDGDAAEGAVIGAVLGTMAGAAIEEQGRREAREKAEAEARRVADEIAQSTAEMALRKSNYRRALTACLEGSGYTVR